MTKERLEQLREAARIGPPRESCKVWTDRGFEAFGQAEYDAIGSHLVVGEVEPISEMPLYGQESSGIRIRFKNGS